MGCTAWHDSPSSLWEADAYIQDRLQRRYGALGLMLEAGERALCRRVLHVACGCGFATRCLSEMGLVPPDGYVGIDADADRIQTARTHLAAMAFRVADPEGALPEGPFDLAIADAVLEHLSDPKAFVQNLRRRLAFMAWVLISVPYREAPDSPQVANGFHSMYGVDEQRLGNLLEPEFRIAETQLWRDEQMSDSDSTRRTLMAKARASGPEFLLLSRSEELSEAVRAPRMAPRPAGG
ncbi:hypothetical protein AMK68_01470 [candidate division KD3-62 bacterium DG_56]|uniref:Methyltransferase type 11 domain-containing protein n=1 Tax=candidate division KD3-62 bacterium DG_56 TaxID=1704032 RepID=A0A0S7XPU1_9BACT|nr:MAG: hypothetical protein AMK68_01470 [candidate division KD3-62 bacterium DG_56]